MQAMWALVLLTLTAFGVWEAACLIAGAEVACQHSGVFPGFLRSRALIGSRSCELEVHASEEQE